MKERTSIGTRFSARPWAAILLLLVGIVSLFTQTKYGRYLPKSNSVRYISQASKMSPQSSRRRIKRRKTQSVVSDHRPRNSVELSVVRSRPDSPPPQQAVILLADLLRAPPLARI
ncbi:MAG: hypothetical protein ACYDA9_18010 [Terriglobia bacterium]